MRCIQFEIHPLSALLGAGAVVVALLVASAVPQHGSERPARVSVVNPLTVYGIADPRNMLVIREASPYTVPTGKLLMITGLGANYENRQTVELRINGTREAAVRHFEGNVGATRDYDSTSIKQTPIGLTASAGSVVSVLEKPSSGSAARAWGYLVDA